MLSITKCEAYRLRKNLLAFTAVRKASTKNEYTIELLHEDGTVFLMRRIDSSIYSTTQLDTAKGIADGLGFERFSVRLNNGSDCIV